ncbi:hypothetical protein H8L32_16365 [Undibacterium sp. CY18W]|uniref:Uncharacterized protein n=1 Tax=Undibacterium hunanense TaxID=2762292 RepID=A0ABR6ZT87_9BURK|nr:hypothetical protein [Undibacterium hunanense]MBC3919067.1 hypothetical protein [Undibacterium hunanense]
MKYFVTLFFALSTITAYADTPLEPPTVLRKESINKEFIVTSDPKEGTVATSRDGKIIWHIPSWFRSFYIANDGEYFVTYYSGLNLIPRDYQDSLPLFTFWKNGKIFKTVSVKEFVTRKSILVTTASHYYWGTVEGVSDDRELRVRRADDVVFFYDIRTGREVKK